MAAQKVSLEKVTASMTLPIPSGVRLQVKKDQKVKEGQIIAKRKASSQTKSYHLSKLIGVSPKKALKFLEKKLGQKVKQGELVAQKKSFLGKSEKFIAPLNGILDSLTEDGILRIKKELAEEEIKAPFTGRVSATTPNSVSFSFAAMEIKGNWGGGKKATGYLMVIEGEDYDLFSLDGTCQEQIVVLRGKLPKGLWHKAISLGAVGFIAGSLADKSLQKEIEEEDDSLPVVVLGLDDKISQEIWGELKKANGQMAFIDGEEKRLLIPG